MKKNTRKVNESYIVTKNEDNYNLLETGILGGYAVKESKQINDPDGLNYNRFIDPPYDPDLLIKLLDLNVWHERCVDVVANDVSGDGFTLIPSEGEDGNPANKKIAMDFFNNIRPSINNVLYRREYDYRSLGYGALEVIRDNGRDSPVIDLKYIPAHNLRLHSDGVKIIQQIGSKKVYFINMDKNKDENNNYYDVDKDTGEVSFNSLPEEQRANELILKLGHDPNSRNPYGKPKVISAIPAIHGDHYRAEYNSSFFKNYGMPVFAVTVTGDFDPGITDPNEEGYDEKETLQYKISEQIRQVISNPHSAMVIQIPSEGEDSKVELNIQPLSVDAKEASFRLYRKDNRDEVIAAHGVDPTRLGITETGKLNGNNSKESDSAYKTSVINPLVRSNLDDINYYILKIGLHVYDWQFTLRNNDDKILTGDIDNVLKLVNAGIMTINEAREFIGEKFGLEKEENSLLDEHYYNGKILSNETNPGAGTVLDNLNDDLNETEVEDDKYSKGSKENKRISAVVKNITNLRKPE